MTTPIYHLLTAFALLVVIKHLKKLEITFGTLILLSFASLLPDVFDKIITGTRYPFHSLIISIIMLSIFYLLGRYFIEKFFYNHLSVQYFSLLMILFSVAYLSHPIMDLEGAIPLFYPIDSFGYHIEFQLNIKQSITPIISNFTFMIIREPYDYSITYDREGSLVSTLDLLFISLLGFSLLIVGVEKIIIWNNERKMGKNP